MSFPDMSNTAAATLEQIRTGGQQVVAMTLGRLIEAQVAVEDGRFTDAGRLIREALHKIDTLAEAQVQLAIFADTTKIVRAGEIEVGMQIIDWGAVERIDEKTVRHAVSGDCEHVLIYLEGMDEPRELHSTTELLVVSGEFDDA